MAQQRTYSSKDALCLHTDRCVSAKSQQKDVSAEGRLCRPRLSGKWYGFRLDWIKTLTARRYTIRPDWRL